MSKELEFLEEKHGHNSWAHYPPSKQQVAQWLKEYTEQQCAIHGVSITLRDKLEDFVSKYWYDNEYRQLIKKDSVKATESREKFRKWFDDNIDAFLKQ